MAAARPLSDDGVYRPSVQPRAAHCEAVWSIILMTVWVQTKPCRLQRPRALLCHGSVELSSTCTLRAKQQASSSELTGSANAPHIVVLEK